MTSGAGLTRPVDDWGHERSGPTPGLDRAVAGSICAAVLQGAKPQRAAATIGVARSTWYDWCARADKGVEPYAELIGSIRLCEDAFGAGLELVVAKAAREGDWKAALELLKARHRSEYGSRDIALPPPLADDLSLCTDAELERIAFGTTPVG